MILGMVVGNAGDERAQRAAGSLPRPSGSNKRMSALSGSMRQPAEMGGRLGPEHLQCLGYRLSSRQEVRQPFIGSFDLDLSQAGIADGYVAAVERSFVGVVIR